MPRSDLKTPRLLLRRWRDADVGAFVELSADPVTMEHLRPLPDRAACEAWVAGVRAHWDLHGFGQWVVEIPGEASVIGVVGLAELSFTAHFTPAIEIAWRLDRQHWGKGYATEAVRAAVDYGFAVLGLSEIVAVTVPANRRSRRVMERLGMRHEPSEDFDHPNLPEGALRRHVLYRLPRPQAA